MELENDRSGIMDFIRTKDLPEGVKTSDYHRESARYFIRIRVFGRSYYIPIVEKTEKVFNFKIKENKKGEIQVEGLREGMLLHDILQVTVASVYYQVRDTVGEDIFQKLAGQIEEGFQGFFKDGLSQLIDENFDSLEPNGIGESEIKRECSTCFCIPCNDVDTEKCCKDNGFPLWEVPTPLYLKKREYYLGKKVYCKFVMPSEGGFIGTVSDLCPDRYDSTRKKVILVVKFIECISKDGSKKVFSDKILFEEEVIRVHCSSCGKFPCDDSSQCICDGGYEDWELKSDLSENPCGEILLKSKPLEWAGRSIVDWRPKECKLDPLTKSAQSPKKQVSLKDTLEKNEEDCDHCRYSELAPCPHLMNISCGPAHGYPKFIPKKKKPEKQADKNKKGKKGK